MSPLPCPCDAIPRPRRAPRAAAAALLVVLLLTGVLRGSGAAREGPPAGTERERLLDALEERVLAYASPLQLLMTAPYYSDAAALEAVLSHESAVAEAAERYGIEKAMLQAVLFQELRFLNVWDEVDLFVEATYSYLRQVEDYNRLCRRERLLAMPPIPPAVFRLDSSTGLGQIFAATAIRAINWREGREVYDETDWHDLSAVWSMLRGDDAYNIETAALVLAYKRAGLREAGAEPTAADVMQAYNGEGAASLRYREAVYGYYLAFRRYGEGGPGRS